MVESKAPWEPCSFTESVSLLFGLVYLIWEKNLIRKAGTQESRKGIT
jgi:hypothetical protein